MKDVRPEAVLKSNRKHPNVVQAVKLSFKAKEGNQGGK